MSMSFGDIFGICFPQLNQ